MQRVGATPEIPTKVHLAPTLWLFHYNKLFMLFLNPMVLFDFILKVLIFITLFPNQARKFVTTDSFKRFP